MNLKSMNPLFNETKSTTGVSSRTAANEREKLSREGETKRHTRVKLPNSKSPHLDVVRIDRQRPGNHGHHFLCPILQPQPINLPKKLCIMQTPKKGSSIPGLLVKSNSSEPWLRAAAESPSPTPATADRISWFKNSNKKKDC